MQLWCSILQYILIWWLHNCTKWNLSCILNQKDFALHLRRSSHTAIIGQASIWNKKPWSHGSHKWLCFLVHLPFTALCKHLKIIIFQMLASADQQLTSAGWLLQVWSETVHVFIFSLIEWKKRFFFLKKQK